MPPVFFSAHVIFVPNKYLYLVSYVNIIVIIIYHKLTYISEIKANLSIIKCTNCTVDIGAEYGDVRPLDEARMRKLTINGVQLLDNINSDILFLAQLGKVKCITWRQREHLDNIVQLHDRNDKLLEFLTRRSIADFQNFITVLAKDQSHLVPLLVTDGGEASLIRRLSVNYYFKKS